MAKLHLPPVFCKKLETDLFWDGIVKLTVSSYSDILDKSRMEFFDEYTDHGITHIQNVLFSSVNLMDTATIEKVLAPKDIAVYILSVVLHDIGMHITTAGFAQLISGAYNEVRIKEFDKLTWSQSWEEFYREAKKFNGKTLKAIFGDESTVIRRPPLENPGDLNNADKKLIGEFVRRNHCPVSS